MTAQRIPTELEKAAYPTQHLRCGLLQYCKYVVARSGDESLHILLADGAGVRGGLSEIKSISSPSLLRMWHDSSYAYCSDQKVICESLVQSFQEVIIEW